MKPEEAKNLGQDLVQMYQAGFLDGVLILHTPRKKRDYKEINRLCKKAFEKRFAKRLQGKIKIKDGKADNKKV